MHSRAAPLLTDRSPARGGSHWLVFAGPVVLAAVVYALLLNRWGLWYDEIKTVQDVGNPFSRMLSQRMLNGHVPGYFALMWGWVRAFGESEWAVRLPAALAGLGCVGLTTELARRHACRWTAVTAGLLLALNPLLADISVQARMYSFAALFGIAGAWWILHCEAKDQRNARASAVLAALWIAGIHTHYSFVMVIISLLGYLLLRRRPDWRLALAGFGPVLAILPWAVATAMRRTHDPLHWLPQPEFGDVVRLLGALSVGTRPVDQRIWLAVLTAAAILFLCIVGWRRLGRLGRMMGFIWAGTLVQSAVVLLVNGHNLFNTHRYFATAICAQAVLVGGGLVQLSRWQRPVGLLAALALVVAAGVSTASLLVRPMHPDYRGAVRHVQSRVAGDEIAVNMAYLPLAFEYYYRAPYVDLTRRPLRDPQFEPDATIDAVADEYRGIRLVIDPWMQRRVFDGAPSGSRVLVEPKAIYDDLVERFSELESVTHVQDMRIEHRRAAPDVERRDVDNSIAPP